MGHCRGENGQRSTRSRRWLHWQEHHISLLIEVIVASGAEYACLTAVGEENSSCAGRQGNICGGYITVFENILVAGLAYKFVLVYGTCTMVHVKASYTNYFSKMSLSLEHSRWGWLWKSSLGEFTLRVWTLLVHPLFVFPPITYTVS